MWQLMITGLTLNNAGEAIGIARAAKSAEIPVVVSFTVEADGKLASGQTLKDAINLVDAETNNAPAYYMLNCAHPDHFSNALTDAPWMDRIIGVIANASRRSHAELDESKVLDDGDPVELGSLIVDSLEEALSVGYEYCRSVNHDRLPTEAIIRSLEKMTYFDLARAIGLSEKGAERYSL